jgi:hypothetical protein
MKKIISVFIVLVLLLAMAVTAQDYDEEFNEVLEEDIYQDVEDVELKGEAGMTPDSALYFVETLLENILVGDNPETALQYKEEKILELKAMIESGNREGAEKALERAEKYNDILKKEVSPEIEKEVRESSKAVKVILEQIDSELEDDWGDVKDSINENLKEEDKIALAAKISNKIAGLCRALSNLDPLEYSKVCKTDDDAPRWKRDLDRELTEEQEQEAKEFFEIMSQCFDNPNECRCDDISVKPFAEQCNIIAPLAAQCDAGDEEACKEIEKSGDPIDLLPDYLQDVMAELEDRYGDSKHDMHVPIECVEAGAESKEACSKVMFKIHAPEPCVKALEAGKIDINNERDSREACEQIMFKQDAPQECIDAGLKSFRTCEKYMFKLDAPQECLDAGLTGAGRDDWKKCDAIRFKLDAPQECLDAGIDGTHRDDWKKCETIRFKLDSPQECLDAGLTGEGKDDWKKCNKITFLLDAPEECHQFADERDPWKKCKPVQFKLEAPQECLDAGLTGEGRRDWDECKKIQKEMEGESKQDCSPDELHICDDEGKNCECTSDSNTGCDAIDCQQGYSCQYGQCFPDEGGCGDCESKCPGASSTDCVDDQCECYYDDKGGEDWKEGCDAILCPENTYCEYGECKSYPTSECSDGCEQECGDENTDCVDGSCVCLGYGPNGPPGSDGGDDSGSSESEPEESSEVEEETEPEPTPEVEESEPEVAEPEPEPESQEESGNEITGGAISFLKGLFN